MTGHAVAWAAGRARRVAAVSTAIAAVALAAPPATATAAAADCAGVTVVVDFTRLGGEVEEGCAPPEVTTGLEALRGAGFSYTFVPQIPGMVCQIDGLPDPCNGAPADAYWAYWVGDTDGGWRYSTEGAGTRTVSPGDRQGWAFGDGQQPGSPTRQRARDHTSAQQAPLTPVGVVTTAALVLGAALLWRRRP